MKIPCSHQKSLFSMFVSLCLIHFPKMSVRVTEVNLITEFLKSEIKRIQIIFTVISNYKLGIRIWFLTYRDTWEPFLFLAIIIKGEMYSFSQKLINRCHNWVVSQGIFVSFFSFCLRFFIFLLQKLLYFFMAKLSKPILFFE